LDDAEGDVGQPLTDGGVKPGDLAGADAVMFVTHDWTSLARAADLLSPVDAVRRTAAGRPIRCAADEVLA
jgi:hypothetical protein